MLYRIFCAALALLSLAPLSAALYIRLNAIAPSTTQIELLDTVAVVCGFMILMFGFLACCEHRTESQIRNDRVRARNRDRMRNRARSRNQF